MNDDIVDRLRADIRIQEEALMCEAADTIERLRESQQAAEVEIADLREYAKSCEAVIDGLHITYAAAAVVGAGSDPKATKLPGENLRDSGMADAGGVSDGPQ